MGGYVSTPAVDPKLESLKKIGNNNTGDVVVIPVDESKYSEAAFEWYVHHAHRPENVVRVIHCQELQLNTPFLPDLKAVTIQEQLQKSHRTGKSLIEKYENKFNKYQIKGSVHSHYGPSPAELVMDTVDRFQGTQVVMGTRGFGILRRTVLGSVSQYIVTHSHVPVTVVPPEVQKRFQTSS